MPPEAARVSENVTDVGAPMRRPIAFLDRDGVINVDHGYVVRPDALELTLTAAEGIRRFNAAGYLVIVATNQSGVARGMFGTADVEAFHDHLRAELAARGAHVDAVYYSPYLAEGSVAEYARAHEDRKPGPGMLLRGLREWHGDAARSIMIGDKASDMEAARRAGIRGILVASDTCDLAAEAERVIVADRARPAAELATAGE